MEDLNKAKKMDRGWKYNLKDLFSRGSSRIH